MTDPLQEARRQMKEDVAHTPGDRSRGAEQESVPSVADAEALTGRLRALHQMLHRPLDYPVDNQRVQIALAHADAMICQLASPPSPWQAIETAPRDGTRVDLWVKTIDHGHETAERVADARWRDGAWQRPDFTYDELPIEENGPAWQIIVTHYMPLPDAPKEKEEDGTHTPGGPSASMNKKEG